MFCEPRRNKLVSHVGNTYSNIVYLFAGICVLLSCCLGVTTDAAGEPTTTGGGGGVFWLPDAVFGVMLMLLGLFSVLWHSSNAPKSHYPDLFTMDACIAYLIIRNAAMVLLALSSSVSCAMYVCLGLYIFFLTRISRFRLGNGYYMFNSGPWDYCCRFSGRRRLTDNDMDINGVCLFSAMPCFYMVIPTLLQVFVVKSVGSMYAGTIASTALAFGWSVRMFERFCLDGWWLQNAIIPNNQKTPPTTLQVLGSAVVSPTGTLHWTTGLTLLFGYVWVRSLDQVILSTM
eukprot:TRINITY_DN16150_c0_g1_i1.p1 TRINITY_DN16150_c0_g1~~TRINITY_DN16150_c0_g1_i1.p1  ORF type:complete len:287 (-),score=29.00 TRINITY_DN16150_c0_g1_i1:109-969(-)